MEVIMPEYLYGVDLLCHTGKDKKDCMRPTKHNRPDFTSCYGMIETQKKSLTLKSWTDMEVTLTPDELRFSTVVDDQVKLDLHTKHAPDFCKSKNMSIFKITSPVFIRCKEDVQFVVCQTPFNFLDFQIPSGIVQFKYQQALNIFMYVPKGEHRNISWNFGEPLLNIFPISDRRVKLKHTYDTDLYYKYMTNYPNFFLKHGIYKMGAKKMPVNWMKT